jgi:VWFA-related protein
MATTIRRSCSASVSLAKALARLALAAMCAASLAAQSSTTNALPAEPAAPGQAASAATAPAPRLVTIDLLATDARGRTVEDLKPGDFELREQGTPLKIESARFVRLTTASTEPPSAIASQADERQAAARDSVRLVAIFLDEYHVSDANSVRVRETIARFVDHDLSPGDLLVVMKPLDSLLAIRLTRDRAAARAAIESFSGRKGDYTPRNEYERDFIAGTPARIESARNQVALSAINALAVHLGSLSDRRKTLVVVTEGIGGSERRRGLENLPTLDTIVRSANRSNVAIYPLDPSDADAALDPASALTQLAAETTGAAIRHDADAALQRAVAAAGAHYLLSFRTAHPDDGKYRDLQASVKRAGVSVQTRRGYWTASPDEALRAALLAKASEPKKVVPPEPVPHVSPLIRPWFGMSRGGSGKTRVTFVWEPAVRVPGERVRQVPTRVVLTVRVGDSVVFEGPVSPTGPAAIDDPAATPSRASFDVPPGRLRTRIAIQDAAAQLLDQDVREISIRDLRGDVAVGSLQVLRARNAREFRTLDAEAAVPVASREFSRTERLLIRFQAYGPSGGAPEVSARLLGRTGRPIRDLEIEPAATPGDSAIDLPLASFANGEYAIEVSAKSGSRDATDRIAFRITS